MKTFIFTLLFSANVFASAFTFVTIASGQSMSTSFQTTCVDMNQLDSGAIQAVWTGSPVGSIDVQISNVITPQCSSIPSSGWSDYTGSAQAISAAGNFTWNLTISGYRWIRLSYTASSGSGSLGAVFTGKGN